MFVRRLEDRTDLRLLERRHADAFFALVDRNRSHLREWLPWVDRTLSAKDTNAHIADGLTRFASGIGMEAGIWHDGQPAGIIGLHAINVTHRATSIGYWLAEEFQGRGLMTMACRALVDHAVDELNLHRIEIRCAAGNTRSRAIPERLGFKAEGTLEDGFWHMDHFRDMVVYGMTAPRWLALRQASSAEP